ncbi:unnamed protein product, partial [Ceratitis capitata]
MLGSWKVTRSENALLTQKPLQYFISCRRYELNVFCLISESKVAGGKELQISEWVQHLTDAKNNGVITT